MATREQIIIILILTILTALLSCGPTANQDKKTPVQSDSIQSSNTEKKLTKEEKQKQIEAENRMDSLRFDIAFKDAFNIAQTTFKKESFRKQYVFQPDDSSKTLCFMEGIVKT